MTNQIQSKGGTFFSYSRVLKVSLFATGLSGIVAEYVLATMATYFLGDSVFQWTIILSLMLFAMGLGSRVSKLIKSRLVEAYVAVEFILSFLTSFSALLIYLVMPYSSYIDLIIYGESIVIGLLIGMEIPLVTRINGEYEQLRTNISSIMENDYFGSLVGGLFFAFIGIRFLGLTYTPFVVGGINLLVAIIVLFKFGSVLSGKLGSRLKLIGAILPVLFVVGITFANPIVIFGNQSRYSEKIIFSKQTPYQQITVTQRNDDYWLYLNQGKQLCTFDEWKYHEALVHPAVGLTKGPIDVLILGAGDGCGIRELLKYDRVRVVTLVDLDSVMVKVGAEHPIFRRMNKDAYHSKKVDVVVGDAFNYLENSGNYYDLIIADFPDPKSIELNRLYSWEFYQLCYRQLKARGVFVTQATSPYYTTKAFRSIEKTMQAAKFNTLAIHDHVYTFGEWGWVIGSKLLTSYQMKSNIHNIPLASIGELRGLTSDLLVGMTCFGQDLVEVDTAKLEVNSIHNPVIYKYYQDGNWSYYF